MKQIAITGASGFIGLHTRWEVARSGVGVVVSIDRDTMSDPATLQDALRDVDVVVHLAGLNRGDPTALEVVNIGLAQRLADALDHGRQTRIVFASSTQRHRDNPYGRAKRKAEQVLAGAEHIEDVVAEITNVFGPGSRPFYNSVVATFCHQLTRGEEVTIHEDAQLELLWVGDLARQLVELATSEDPPGHVVPGPHHGTTVLELADELSRLRDVHFERRWVPDTPSPLSHHLYGTLVTYAEPQRHEHRPQHHSDDRGGLFEAVQYQSTEGQAFVSTSAPHVVRGDHYHTRKHEKFCVLAGEAVIRLRWMGGDEVVEFPVDGSSPAVVDMPWFWAHHIENVGDTELITLFWASELFDPDDADTWIEPVL